MPDWPRLSEQLPGPKHPEKCQSCGGPYGLARWREHDDADRPERVVVVLCRGCSDRLIEPHPRLYGRLHENDPAPGCMPLCLDCRHRDGVRCAHPDARANGGTGVLLTIAKPITAHVCRSPRRLSGWVTLWPSPAQACKSREEVAHARD